MLTHRKKKKQRILFVLQFEEKNKQNKIEVAQKTTFFETKKTWTSSFTAKEKKHFLAFFSYIYVLTWEWTKIFFGCSNPFAKSFFFASNIKETFEKETKKKLSKVKSASLSSRENANAHDFQEERRHFKCWCFSPNQRSSCCFVFVFLTNEDIFFSLGWFWSWTSSETPHFIEAIQWSQSQKWLPMVHFRQKKIMVATHARSRKLMMEHFQRSFQTEDEPEWRWIKFLMGCCKVLTAVKRSKEKFLPKHKNNFGCHNEF